MKRETAIGLDRAPKCAGIVVFITLSVCSVMPVRAGTIAIYSNFGPSVTFDTNPLDSWTINGFLGVGIGQQAIAEQFTPSGNYRFTDALVAVSLFGGPDSIHVFLQADSSGLPGAVVEMIPITGLRATPAILSANSVLFPILQSGTPYWLTLVAGADGVIAGWSWNSIGDASADTFAGTQGGSPAGPWGKGVLSTRGVFQIDGTPAVPEPSTLLLLGTALMALFYFARRNVASERGQQSN